MIQRKFAFYGVARRLFSSIVDSARVEQYAASLLGKVVEPITGQTIGSIGVIQVISHWYATSQFTFL